jgi:hypothetical protein
MPTDLIVCGRCDAFVEARVLSEVDVPETEQEIAHNYAFLQCPRCHHPVVAQRAALEADDGRWIWGNPQRVWPSPEAHLSHYLPPLVRKSLAEAFDCFKVGAFNACAVMCGRALEAIGAEKGAKGSLGVVLKTLRDEGVIDGRRACAFFCVSGLSGVVGDAVSEVDA